MNSPKVSVIIPSFDRFSYLLNSLTSVLNQTYRNFEIIIINDGSSEKEYKSYKFPKSVKIVHIDKKDTPNWGGSRQPLRNIGSSYATGEYLAFLDDDDIWMKNKLELQIKKMLDKSFLFSSTEGYFGHGIYDENKEYQKYNSERFIKTLKKKYKGTGLLKRGVFPEVWDHNFLQVHNCVILSSVIIQKELFDRLGGFRGLPKAADYDCWLGLLKLTNLLYINEPLFYYDAGHGDGKLYS
tara:strand:+ start:438 stop:1154 length:717 start_codon:yes stop_codon:yes gene_type:complete